MSRSLIAAMLGAAVCCAAVAAAQTAPGAGNRKVSGVVVSGRSGEPLDDVEVKLSTVTVKDRKLVSETITDGQGRFSFANLADGKYSLHASRRGFVDADYEQHDGRLSTAIVTGEGMETTGLRFTLEPEGVIFGVVTEDSGDPVPQGRVSLFRKDPWKGTGAMTRAGMASADALGNFELGRLAPGEYYLCAEGVPWYATHRRPDPGTQNSADSDQSRPPLDVAYGLSCYPGVSDWNAAAPVHVGAGERVEVDFEMHAVPAVHISIQVASADGQHGFITPQLRENLFGTSELVQAGASFFTHQGPNGSDINSFEITGVAPGQYEVQIPPGAGSAGRFTTIDAPTANARVDASSAPALASVSGRLAMADGSKLPASIFAALRPRQGGDGANGPVEADGSFRIDGVRPGEYALEIGSHGTPLAVIRMKQHGSTLAGSELKVGSEPVEVAATVAEAMATVNGFVVRDGKPASGVFVVMVPADAQAAPSPRMLDQSNSDGSFAFEQVAPGSYTVVAIEQGWTLDWALHEAVAKYLANGVRLTVTPESRAIALKEHVEAQPK
jgi:hypothetical protein